MAGLRILPYRYKIISDYHRSSAGLTLSSNRHCSSCCGGRLMERDLSLTAEMTDMARSVRARMSGSSPTLPAAVISTGGRNLQEFQEGFISKKKLRFSGNQKIICKGFSCTRHPDEGRPVYSCCPQYPAECKAQEAMVPIDACCPRPVERPWFTLLPTDIPEVDAHSISSGRTMWLTGNNAGEHLLFWYRRPS